MTVKSIETDKYRVTMHKTDYDEYFIFYANGEGPNFSENIKDFPTASFLFDLKVRELEGQ